MRFRCFRATLNRNIAAFPSGHCLIRTDPFKFASQTKGIVGCRFPRCTVQDIASDRLQTLGLFRDLIVGIHID